LHWPCATVWYFIARGVAMSIRLPFGWACRIRSPALDCTLNVHGTPVVSVAPHGWLNRKGSCRRVFGPCCSRVNVCPLLSSLIHTHTHGEEASGGVRAWHAIAARSAYRWSRFFSQPDLCATRRGSGLVLIVFMTLRDGIRTSEARRW